MTTSLAIVGLLIFAPPALATPSSIPDETWATDGRVSSIVQAGDRVYLGGTFRNVGPNVGNGVALSPADGQLEAAFPKVHGTIRAAFPDGSGGWFIGGEFSKVGSYDRSRLAHVLADGTVDASWNPGTNNTVYALAVSADGRRVYAGGNFSRVGGTARNRLAAMDAATGAVDAQWNVGADNYVRSLAVSGERVYIGGDFTAVNGQSRTRLARVDGVSGTLDPIWTPTANSSVLSFYPSSDGTSVYVGGAFSNVNGQARRYLWALDSVTGAVVPSWNPDFVPVGQVYDLELAGTRVYAAEGGSNGLGVYDALTGVRVTVFRGDGDVQALAILNGKLYAGGHFRKLGGLPFDYFAALDLATGKLDKQWKPNGQGHAGPWALLPDASGGRLYAGGDFTSISGRPQQGFAQFSE